MPIENVRGLYRTEYEKLIELGIFEDQRIELLEGQLIDLGRQSAAHATIVARTGHVLYRFMPPSMLQRHHSALVAGMRSVPTPDIAVVTEPTKLTDPHPSEAFLVIEVAETTQDNDLTMKPAIYAAMGVPEYWVVDISTDTVAVHTHPTVFGYETKAVHRRGDWIVPICMPIHRVHVNEIFDGPQTAQ